MSEILRSSRGLESLGFWRCCGKVGIINRNIMNLYSFGSLAVTREQVNNASRALESSTYVGGETSLRRRLEESLQPKLVQRTRTKERPCRSVP